MLKFTTRLDRPETIPRLATALLLATAFGTMGAAEAQGPAAAAIPPDVVGIWIDHTQQGAVEIKPCDGKLCGYVVWMQKQTDDKGKPVTDAQNPDAAKRKTPLCGLQIIGDVAPSKSGNGFENGWIYNPDDGVRYDVDVKPGGRDRLTVHGFAGLRFLGETFTWTRAPNTLERCRTA